jgi:LPS sulfotransferase NodH
MILDGRRMAPVPGAADGVTGTPRHSATSQVDPVPLVELPLIPGTAQAGEPQVVLSCLVTSTPWAGSRQLCRALDATDAVGNPEDYFDPLKVVPRSRAWDLLGTGDGFPVRYLIAVRQAATGVNGVCSANLWWSHARWLIRMARAASNAGIDRPESDADAVAALFPNTRYLHVRARDTPRQALRWYAAQHPELLDGSGALSPGRITRPDFQEVRWLEALIDRQEQAWIKYFDVHGIVAHIVDYEQLVVQPDETVGTVLRSLGLNRLSAATWRPTGDGGDDVQLDAWLGQYASVREKLQAKVGVRGDR